MATSATATVRRPALRDTTGLELRPNAPSARRAHTARAPPRRTRALQAPSLGRVPQSAQSALLALHALDQARRGAQSQSPRALQDRDPRVKLPHASVALGASTPWSLMMLLQRTVQLASTLPLAPRSAPLRTPRARSRAPSRPPLCRAPRRPSMGQWEAPHARHVITTSHARCSSKVGTSPASQGSSTSAPQPPASRALR